MAKLILFNKPFQVLCQFTSTCNSLTLADFIPIQSVYPVGRLDKNSEGLLLLTDCGRLQHRLSHPKFGKKKRYWVQVEGIPTNYDFEPLRQGLFHKGQKFLPAEVQMITEPDLWPRDPPIRYRANIPTTWLEIVLQEGKNHQIRKMTAAIGFPTLRLIRYQIANFKLENLKPGEYKETPYFAEKNNKN